MWAGRRPPLAKKPRLRGKQTRQRGVLRPRSARLWVPLPAAVATRRVRHHPPTPRRVQAPPKETRIPSEARPPPCSARPGCTPGRRRPSCCGPDRGPRHRPSSSTGNGGGSESALRADDHCNELQPPGRGFRKTKAPWAPRVPTFPRRPPVDLRLAGRPGADPRFNQLPHGAFPRPERELQSDPS